MKRHVVISSLAVLVSGCGGGGESARDASGVGAQDLSSADRSGEVDQTSVPDAPATLDAGADRPAVVDLAGDWPSPALDTTADLTVTVDAPSPPLPWTRRGTAGVAGTDRPGHRRGHAMAYDESRARVVLFGGHASEFYCASGVCADTWEWDGAAGSWAKRAPGGGVAPPAREGHAMTYDPIRGRVLLHGGSDGVVFQDGGFHSSFRQDTWEWDGGTWSEVTPAGAKPSPRQSAGLVWDRGRGRALLFGGGEYDGANPRADVWEWDGASATWTPRAPAVSPPARQGHAMAYYPSRATVLAFGGSTGSSLLDDTWEWNGATGAWSPIPLAVRHPPGRVFACLEYHAGRGLLLMVGGAGSALVTTSETWAWSAPSGWANLGAAAEMPGRAYHAMAYDSARGKLVVFGGVASGGSQILDDLWEL